MLDHYDYETLRRAIADLCQRSTGPTWSEVATQLSRYGAWESERLAFSSSAPGAPSRRQADPPHAAVRVHHKVIVRAGR